MKSKILRISILLLLIASLKTSAQTQIGLIKKPEWNSSSSPFTRQGSAVALSNNMSAMIVNVPKSDFAIVALDDRLNQKWLTPLSGFALAIGKFKGHVIVISASQGTFIKSFTSTFKASVLDEQTGKILKEKIIYEGSADYFEDPDFFFAEDGSYFKMTSRLTAMKRSSVIFSTVINLESKYLGTQEFNIITFDDQLNIVDHTNPIMPAGDTWQSTCNEDGSFIITTVDKKSSVINVATYISSKREPLKLISVPIDFGKGVDYSSIKIASSKTPLQSYVSTIYKNAKKEQVLFVAKLDFKDGSVQKTTETLDKNYFKNLEKSYVPVNKELDDAFFSNSDFSFVGHIEEFNDKLMVSLSQSISYAQGGQYDGSVLVKIYDQQLKSQYQQIIPRSYKSVFGEGSITAYSLNGKNLRMLANHRDGNSVNAIYGELNLDNGQLVKMNLINKEDMKSDYYANTKSIAWNNKSFMIPYFDQIGMLKFKVNIQVQLLTY